jgi:hypothetical protein
MNDTIITWIVLIIAIPLVFYCFLYTLDKEKKAKDLKAELNLAEQRISSLLHAHEIDKDAYLGLLYANRRLKKSTEELSTTNKALQEQIYYLKMRLRQAEIMRDSLLGRIEKLKSDLKEHEAAGLKV